jgi:hypothetical protein
LIDFAAAKPFRLIKNKLSPLMLIMMMWALAHVVQATFETGSGR